MIKTTAEYKEAAEFINKDIELYDFALSEKMSSYEYNLYLQDVEYYFDFLYEKIRTIEDMIAYLEFYSEEKINKAKQSLDSKLNILSRETSKYIDTSHISYEVNWETNPNTSEFDRDGTLLPLAIVKNGSVVPSGDVYNVSKIKNIYKESNNVPFSDNISTYLSDDYYIANYELDNPNKIVEKFYVELDSDLSKINYVNIDPFNCEVEVLDDIADGTIKLNVTTNNFFKRLENFDYDSYCGANTNKLNNVKYNYNVSATLNNNQNTYADVLDSSNIKEYLNDISRKISTLNYQTENSNNVSRSLTWWIH